MRITISKASAEQAFDALRMRTHWYILRSYPVPDEMEAAYRELERALGHEPDKEQRTTGGTP